MAVHSIADIVRLLHDGWQLSMCKMFFMIPAPEAGRMRFAFIWQGIQYAFSHLSQGLNHSLTIRVAHTMLAKELEMLTFPQEVTVGQRICDICLKR